MTGNLWAQGRQIRAPFFRALKTYDESGSLVRAVFRKGIKVLIEEHAQDDLVVVATHFRVGRLNASPELCRMAAETARRALTRGVRDSGGLVEVDVGDWVISARTIVPSLNLRDAFRAHLALFHLEDDEFELDRGQIEAGREGVGAAPADWKVLREMVSDPGPSLESASAITPETLTRFLADFYTPDNSVLTAVGTVRREQALAILAEEISDFKLPEGDSTTSENGRNTSSKSVEPQAEKESAAAAAAQGGGFRYRQERRDIPQARILLGFRVPGEDESEGLAVDLLRYVLTEGHASLLELPREDEEIPPAFVMSRFRPLSKGRLLVFELHPTGTLEKAEVRVLAALEALSKSELPVRLLKRAKALMVADWYGGLESLDSRSASLARAESRGGYKTRDGFPARVAAVTADELRQVAKEYCLYSRAALLELLPTGFEPRNFTSESFRETLDILVPAAVEQQEGFLAAISALGQVNAFKPPDFKPEFADLPPRRSSVLRGPEIYLREDHRQPLVHVAFYFTGGLISESGKEVGLTRLLTAALLDHLRRAGGGATLLALESTGARISMVTQEDFFGLQTMVLSPGFEAVFLGLVDWLHSGMTLSDDEIRAAASRLAAGQSPACSGASDPLVASGLGTLFGDHPYGHGCGVHAAGGFSTEQVEAWRKQLTENIHPTIVVSGNIAGTAFLEGLVSKLSNPRYVQGRLPGTRVTYPAEIPVRESEGRRAVLLFSAPRRGSAEIPMLDVAGRLLNGAGGRLTRRLRQDGIGYHGSLSLESFVRGGALWLEAEAAPGKLADAEALALEETRKLTERSVVPFDFRAAQVATISAWLLRQRDPAAYLYDTMEAALAEEPADYGNRYILTVRSLRMGEVEQALERYTGEVQ